MPSTQKRLLLLMVSGFLGALLGGFIVLMIGRSRRDGFNPMRIILAGAAISALLTALSQGVALVFRLNQSLTFLECSLWYDIINLEWPHSYHYVNFHLIN